MIHHRPLGILVAAWLWAGVAVAEPRYTMAVREAQRIEAELAFTIETPKLKAIDWIVFVAKPPELPCQRELKSTFDPRAEVYREQAGFGREVLRLRVPVKPGSEQEKRLASSVKYEAVLFSRRLERREEAPAATAPSLSRRERDDALRKTPLFDYRSPQLQAWLDEHDLQRRDEEQEVDFARRVFQAVVRNTEYDYKSEMSREASHVCTAGSSDCGGMAVLFCSALRAGGVPARALAGCWAKSAAADGMLNGVRYYQTHVKAEFFADGVGWVPVDCSSAVLHDRTAEKLRYFGNDPGDFLTLHVDPELKVDSVYFGTKTLPWLQQFNFFVRGKGTLAGLKREMNWTVESQ